MSKILKIRARQVFDSRGNPTIEAEVYTRKSSSSKKDEKPKDTPTTPMNVILLKNEVDLE